MSHNHQTYTFGDDSSPVRPGQKHRRARGHASRNKKKSAAPSNGRNNAAANGNGRNNVSATPAARNDSYLGGGQNYSPAAARANQTQPQTFYSTGGGWNSNNNNNNNNSSNNNNNNDDNNSLQYSTSSSVSVQSAESSSNSSSFGDFLKHIDSDLDLKDFSDPEMKKFMAEQTKAANDHARVGHTQHGRMRGMGMEMPSASGGAPPPAAVAEYLQRRGHQQQMHAQQAKKNQYGMSGAKLSPSGQVDWNDSRDSSEGDVYGVEFNEHEEQVLETIASLDRDDDAGARHTVTITSRKSQAVGKAAHNEHIFRDQDSFFRKQQDPYPSPSNSPSSPRNRAVAGHVTPPPNSRNRRTSTPPGASLDQRAHLGAAPISRTSSRQSRSSSDGSFDTPPPSSPPHGGGGSMHSKPPCARSSPVSKPRRRSGQKEDKLAKSGAFYQNPWFCGFTDALNLGG